LGLPDVLSSHMRSKMSVTVSTMNMPTTDMNLDVGEDKLFKKFIMRKNIEDSIFDDSKESIFSNKKSRKAGFVSGLGKSINSSQTSASNTFSSPNREKTNMLIRTIPTNGAAHIRKPESRVIGKSVVYGDKLNKKQVKSMHPLGLFVNSFNLGRHIHDTV
jgi:hypothetical protein